MACPSTMLSQIVLGPASDYTTNTPTLVIRHSKVTVLVGDLEYFEGLGSLKGVGRFILSAGADLNQGKGTKLGYGTPSACKTMSLDMILVVVGTFMSVVASHSATWRMFQHSYALGRRTGFASRSDRGLQV